MATCIQSAAHPFQVDGVVLRLQSILEDRWPMSQDLRIALITVILFLVSVIGAVLYKHGVKDVLQLEFVAPVSTVDSGALPSTSRNAGSNMAMVGSGLALSEARSNGAAEAGAKNSPPESVSAEVQQSGSGNKQPGSAESVPTSTQTVTTSTKPATPANAGRKVQSVPGKLPPLNTQSSEPPAMLSPVMTPVTATPLGANSVVSTVKERSAEPAVHGVTRLPERSNFQGKSQAVLPPHSAEAAPVSRSPVTLRPAILEVPAVGIERASDARPSLPVIENGSSDFSSANSISMRSPSADASLRQVQNTVRWNEPTSLTRSVRVAQSGAAAQRPNGIEHRPVSEANKEQPREVIATAVPVDALAGRASPAADVALNADQAQVGSAAILNTHRPVARSKPLAPPSANQDEPNEIAPSDPAPEEKRELIRPGINTDSMRPVERDVISRVSQKVFDTRNVRASYTDAGRSRVRVVSYDIERYVILQGDSFDSIAQSIYGSAAFGPALARYNRSKIQSTVLLVPGGHLKLPPVGVLRRLLAGVNPTETAAVPHAEVTTASDSQPDPASFSAIAANTQPARAPNRFAADHAIDINGPTFKPQSTAPASPSVNVKQESIPTFTVTKTDTLFAIAKRTLGDGLRWREIYDLNRDRLDNSIDLPIGVTLRLPSEAKLR